MVNFNGDLLPDSNHFLNHENRGLRYGDALSETLRYTGKALLFWEDHYFRLMASMRQLRMEIPMAFTLEYLQGEVEKTLAASGYRERPAAVRLGVFRKEGGGYLPDTLEVSFTIAVEPIPEAGYRLGEGPFEADIFRDYFLQADGLSRLDHNHRLVHVLASIYARENDLQTCLLLNHKKEVAEGVHGTLFVRKGRQVKTPPAGSGCSEGVLRKLLLKQGGDGAPYDLVEEAVSPFELQQADELFLADLIRGIQPVTRYRKATYSREASAYFTERLNALVREGG